MTFSKTIACLDDTLRKGTKDIGFALFDGDDYGEVIRINGITDPVAYNIYNNAERCLPDLSIIAYEEIIRKAPDVQEEDC